MSKLHTKFGIMAAMMACMASTYGMSNMFDVEPRRTPTPEVEKKYCRAFRKKREDETDEEYQAAWNEERKLRLQADVLKKGLTVFEINGELIPARNEREAQKRYKHRHK